MSFWDRSILALQTDMKVRHNLCYAMFCDNEQHSNNLHHTVGHLDLIIAKYNIDYPYIAQNQVKSQ